MSRTSLICGGLLTILLWSLAPPEISAQTRQRITLRNARGESGRAVAGRVTGALAGEKYRDYYFSAPAGRSADISVSTDAGEKVVFDLIAPQGRRLFENTVDLLEELPRKGIYTIRVYRTKEAADKNGSSSFQLAIFMYL